MWRNDCRADKKGLLLASSGTRPGRSIAQARARLRCSAFAAFLLMGVVLPVAAGTSRDDDVAELKKMLLQQQSIIEEQGKQLRQQAELLRKLAERVDHPSAVAAVKPAPPAAPSGGQAAASPLVLSKTGAGTPPTTVPSAAAPAPFKRSPTRTPPTPAKTPEQSLLAAVPGRDSVGDMNAKGVEAGAFPGSIKIPGPYDVSMAIGGFVKTALIVDTNQESSGADFLPALLGTRNNDRAGNTSIDASLTRFNLDARAPTPLGALRGYVEFDLNKNNNGSLDPKLRHAYGTWKSAWGTLTTGQTWTTFMDLKVLPESVTEPTVSGAIFQRQPLIRWSQALGRTTSFDLAVEDPNSNDVFSQQPELGRSPSPDVIGAVELAEPGLGHVRLGAIYRRIELARNVGPGTGQDGWGASAGAHLDAFEKDRWTLAGTYGEGVGRYLLGIAPAAGGVVDPTTEELRLRTNFGGMTAYQRFWTDTLRSNFAVGYAQSATLRGQPDNAFKSTAYAYANLMWTILPYLTVGFEYDYGVRWNRDGRTLDNSRFLLGVQVF